MKLCTRPTGTSARRSAARRAPTSTGRCSTRSPPIAAAEDVDLVVVAGDLFDTSTPSPESRGDRLPGPARPRRHGRDRRRHRRQPRQRPPPAGRRPAARARQRPPRHRADPTRRRRRAGVDDTRRHRRAHRHAAVRVQAGHRARRRPDGRRGVRERPALQRPAAPADRRAVRAASTRTRSTSSPPTPSCSAPSTGGGERPAHLVDEYAVTAPSFPPTIGYGALGHLHRPQRIPAGPALHYCGSPLQLDFGEGEQPKQVNVVTVEPGVPADVRAGAPARRAARCARSSARSTSSPSSTVDDDPWLRVVVRGPRRAGLADDVRAAARAGRRRRAPRRPDAVAGRPARRRPPRPQPAGAVRRVPGRRGRRRRPGAGAVRRAARRGASTP